MLVSSLQCKAFRAWQARQRRTVQVNIFSMQHSPLVQRLPFTAHWVHTFQLMSRSSLGDGSRLALGEEAHNWNQAQKQTWTFAFELSAPWDAEWSKACGRRNCINAADDQARVTQTLAHKAFIEKLQNRVTHHSHFKREKWFLHTNMLCQGDVQRTLKKVKCLPCGWNHWLLALLRASKTGFKNCKVCAFLALISWSSSMFAPFLRQESVPTFSYICCDELVPMNYPRQRKICWAQCLHTTRAETSNASTYIAVEV